MDGAIIDLALFIYESDAIEGIEDDPDLLMRQIANRENTGHVGAMLFLESMAQDAINHYLDERTICKVQELITAEQHFKPGSHKLTKEQIGQYRRVDVKIGGRFCIPPEEVHLQMAKIIKGINWWQQNARFLSIDQNIKRVSDFHFEFETIHPFADGNGRTGRALTYYLFRFACMKPFIFLNSDKHETYYRCFENKDEMRKYFFERAGFGYLHKLT